MKKLLVLVFLSAFLMGCGAAQKSEFWQHGSMYRTTDHLKYSWFGYKAPNPEWGEKSVEQGWWGIEIPYVPGQ